VRGSLWLATLIQFTDGCEGVGAFSFNGRSIAQNRERRDGCCAGGYLAAMLGTTGDVKDFETGENLKQQVAWRLLLILAI
jgi:hypothetical protein